MPTGLGARDTLRLEAGMPLYGHELSEDDQSLPGRAGLRLPPGRATTSPAATPCCGSRSSRSNAVRVGLELARPARRPRRDLPILAGGQPVGQVTSGTFSPTLQKPIAMGYVRPEFAEPGTELQIDIRGRQEPARVVQLPFYRRNKVARRKPRRT